MVDGDEIIKALNTSDMSYYDFDKVDLPIARRVEKEGIKALLMMIVTMVVTLLLSLLKSLIIAFCVPEVSSKVTDIDDAKDGL